MSKDSLIQDIQLQVIEINTGLVILGNAVPANLDLSYTQNTSRVFLKTEGIDQITVANGACDTQAEVDAITFQSEDDATGKFSVLVRFNEPLSGLVSAEIVDRFTGARYGSTISFTTGGPPGSGLTLLLDKVLFEFQTGVDLSNPSNRIIGNLVVKVGPAQ
jgi:hypothetical protein